MTNLVIFIYQSIISLIVTHIIICSASSPGGEIFAAAIDPLLATPEGIPELDHDLIHTADSTTAERKSTIQDDGKSAKQDDKKSIKQDGGATVEKQDGSATAEKPSATNDSIEAASKKAEKVAQDGTERER